MSNGYLKECFIHDTNQYHALDEDVWNMLEVPRKLYLFEDNKRVFVSIDEVNSDLAKKRPCKIIGVLTDDDAESIIKYLEKGWTNNLYVCRLSRVDKKADENKRFSVAISIKALATK